jgi:hypothetical protein
MSLWNNGLKWIIIPAVDETNIDWNEVVKKEARGINDADFGEVQACNHYNHVSSIC